MIRPNRLTAPLWLLFVASAISLAAGTAAGFTLGTDTGREPTAPAAGDATDRPGVSSQQPAPPPRQYHQPKPEDFKLTMKTLEKKCFGSAGCNIKFRIELSYSGDDLDPKQTYQITYEVKGGEDPLINTLTLTGEHYNVDEKESIGTTSANVGLTVVVLDVSEK